MTFSEIFKRKFPKFRDPKNRINYPHWRYKFFDTKTSFLRLFYHKLSWESVLRQKKITVENDFSKRETIQFNS